MSIPVALLVAEDAENKVQLDQISKKAVPDMGAICVCRDSHPPAPISCMTQAKMSVRSHSGFQVGCVVQRLLGSLGGVGNDQGNLLRSGRGAGSQDEPQRAQLRHTFCTI